MVFVPFVAAGAGAVQPLVPLYGHGYAAGVWPHRGLRVEDEIDARRDALIAALQEGLHRASRNPSLFVVRLSVV